MRNRLHWLLIISFIIMMSFLSCHKGNDSFSSDMIAFEQSPFDSSFGVSLDTKASVVTDGTLNSGGFYASATTGSAGSETSKWNSVLFTKSGDYFVGGKYWPATNPSYHFYASNNALSFNAAGTTVSATNATDVVCAYMPSPTYNSANSLTFNHIFARLGNVTISAVSGYTVTGISVSITPKTGGTYNIRTGNGQTNGTGWSSLTTGSATAIANSSPGTRSNDLWLVPGDYDISFSWTATRGDYTQSFSGKTATASLMAGKINNISASLGGDAEKIVMGVEIAPWGSNSINAERPTPPPPTFGGLQISPGPLYFNGSSYAMYDDWNNESYIYAYGKNSGSTYFTYIQMGELFEKTGFSTSDGSIENILDPLDGWRLPTNAEWCTLTTGASPGTSRTGSTVNGNSGSKYALIQLTGVTHAGSSTPVGLLLFPDGKTIIGKTLSGVNNTTCTTGVTDAELNVYLNQGCVFFPTSGMRFDGDWYYGGTNGLYWSSTENNSSNACNNYFTSSSVIASTYYTKSLFYFPVRLVKSAN